MKKIIVQFTPTSTVVTKGEWEGHIQLCARERVDRFLTVVSIGGCIGHIQLCAREGV